MLDCNTSFQRAILSNAFRRRISTFLIYGRSQIASPDVGIPRSESTYLRNRWTVSISSLLRGDAHDMRLKQYCHDHRVRCRRLQRFRGSDGVSRNFDNMTGWISSARAYLLRAPRSGAHSWFHQVQHLASLLRAVSQ